jgi:hypothetical protein
MDDLITDYMTLGVKGARTTYRLLNGTREVNTALPNCERKQPSKD